MTRRRRARADVTLVTQYFPPERGAAQVRLGAIVADLVRRGLDVDVVTALPNYPTGRIFDGWPRRPLTVADERGAAVHRVWVYAAMGSGIRRMLNYASFGAMSVLGLLSAPGARRIVVEYPTLFGALPAVAVGSLRRRSLVVVIVADLWVDSIVEIGTLADGRLVALLRRLERWMLRRADVVTAVTDGVRSALVDKGVDPERIAWLPNGADTDLFHPGAPAPGTRERFGLDDDEHLILYAGTHGYVHGLDVVLDAAALLGDLPVRFVLVGDGSEKPALRARASSLGLANVTFLEPVEPDVVAELLRCSLAALATVRRGDVYRTIRSAKAVPAMASGRPVIYSGDDEGSRLVEQIGSGPVTPPGDPEALADAVRRLLDDPELVARQGSAGREWALGHASWHRLVGDWLEEVDRISGRGGTGEHRRGERVTC